MQSNKNGITALYCRLSRDDGTDSELPPMYELTNFSSMAEAESSLAEKIIA